MIKIHPRVNSILFTILHFCVDGICAYTLFSLLLIQLKDEQYKFMLLMIYNCIAFLTQPFFGLLIDIKDNKERYFLIVSVALIFLGIAFNFVSILSVILLGLGNSIFHISGGKYVISKTKNNIIDLGIFVSSGALGLSLGCNYNSLYLKYSLLIIIALVTFLIFMSKESKEILENPKDKTCEFNLEKTFILLMLVCIVVLLRSFVGRLSNVTFAKTSLILVLFGLSSMLGKLCGGIIGKYLGINKTILISLSISILLLILGNSNLYAYLFGLFFFNMSMPLTLFLANKIIDKQGFSFGLLAAFLIPGYLLGMVEVNDIVNKLLIGLACVASIIITIYTNNIVNKNDISLKKVNNE